MRRPNPVQPLRLIEMRMSVAATLNVGRYENLRVEVGFTAAMQPGDDREAVRKQLLLEVERALAEACRDVLTPYSNLEGAMAQHMKGTT